MAGGLAMAIKWSRDEKEQEELERYIRRRHLDQLGPEDLKRAVSIMKALYAHGLNDRFYTEIGNDQLKTGYLNALMEQNWMIIRQLNNLNEKLDSLAGAAHQPLQQTVRENLSKPDISPAEESEKARLSGPVFCLKCGAENPPGSLYCSGCKTIL